MRLAFALLCCFLNAASSPVYLHCFFSRALPSQWKVRRSLAFSIHEVARLVGPEITERELVPVFNSFLKDLDEVCMVT